MRRKIFADKTERKRVRSHSFSAIKFRFGAIKFRLDAIKFRPDAVFSRPDAVIFRLDAVFSRPGAVRFRLDAVIFRLNAFFLLLLAMTSPHNTMNKRKPDKPPAPYAIEL